MSEENQKKYQNKYIFDYLKNILTTKSKELYLKHINDTENFKSFPFVVILRYLTMSNDSKVRNIILVNQQSLENLDKIGHKYVYKWLIDNIPYQNNSFIKYIK